MSVKKAKDIETALLKKGFRSECTARGNSHRFYTLWIDGKKTRINTYLSHDGKDYGDKLLTEIKRQLRFSDKKQLLEYIDCHMSEEKYIDHIKQSVANY